MAGRRPRAWIVSTVVLTIIVGAAIWVRGRGITSRRDPWPLEAQAARSVRRYLTPAEIRNTPNPVPNSLESVRAGMTHFADHCATCHANDGSGDVPLGQAMFPKAPDMRAATTQSMTDGELFYVIEHGIPLSGMAAWGNGTEQGRLASWELVRFIRHLSQMTDAEMKEMESLNPRSPAEEKQAKDINDFLSGKGKDRGKK